MPLIFQYGSNCSETRLNSPDRLNGNARNPRRVQTVEDYDIAFAQGGTGTKNSYEFD